MNDALKTVKDFQNELYKTVGLKTPDERDYAVCSHAVDMLSIVCAADSAKTIDLLTGYLWDEEEASKIKQQLHSNYKE